MNNDWSIVRHDRVKSPGVQLPRQILEYSVTSSDAHSAKGACLRFYLSALSSEPAGAGKQRLNVLCTAAHAGILNDRRMRSNDGALRVNSCFQRERRKGKPLRGLTMLGPNSLPKKNAKEISD